MAGVNCTDCASHSAASATVARQRTERAQEVSIEQAQISRPEPVFRPDPNRLLDIQA